jgi:hypothetical protein
MVVNQILANDALPNSALLEFGWSSVEFTKKENGTVRETRDSHHAIVKEHSHKRNGKFCPDARDVCCSSRFYEAISD